MWSCAVIFVIAALNHDPAGTASSTSSDASPLSMFVGAAVLALYGVYIFATRWPYVFWYWMYVLPFFGAIFLVAYLNPGT
ncbi:MAG: hypothetical protein H6512_14195 [Acidimicrobiia bacterium]|nr:hypothetical protein [Acidimicrobiia bacterium]